MKIYISESQNFMGYTLLGDHNKEYNTKVVSKEDDWQEKCIQMALFYKLANKPIYTRIKPSIYMHLGVNGFHNELTLLDYYNIKDLATKNLFFKKYSKLTGQILDFIPFKEYTERDNEILANLYSQLNIKERDLIILSNKIIPAIKLEKE